MANRLLIYLGDSELGDFNSIAKNRKLTETLKSESSNATADTFTFEVNWKLFKQIVYKRYDDPPQTYLRVCKTRVVFEIDGQVRFAGFLASKPSRQGLGAEQVLSLTFHEYFARLSGDLVCDPSNKLSPVRTFTNVPAHQYVQALINEFKARATAAGETLNWDWGTVNTLANKTMEYKDFQTISKALCDAMNNTTGAGKFDIVFRTDPADYTHQYIDILKPRGRQKNIRIKYPSDGVYRLWASDYSVEEMNEYASEVLVAGNGEVGEPAEQTANLGVATDTLFAKNYGYWRTYDTQSNLETQAAVDAAASTKLSQLTFTGEAPDIELVGVPINWGVASDLNKGLAVGDTFYFEENTDDTEEASGWYRIVAMETSWDNNGVATVRPTLSNGTGPAQKPSVQSRLKEITNEIKAMKAAH